MLNPFLTDPAQPSESERERWTDRLRQAMRQKNTEGALSALAFGADPHAGDERGELLFAQAMESHHPKLVAAFYAVGGDYRVNRSSPEGPFTVTPQSGGPSSRVYAPGELAAAKVLATFEEFDAASARLRTEHRNTVKAHPARRSSCDFSNPEARHQTLMSVIGLLRQALYQRPATLGQAAMRIHPLPAPRAPSFEASSAFAAFRRARIP